MKVYISATLRNYFGKNHVIETAEDNIRSVLKFLTDEYPDAKQILFDENEKKNTGMVTQQNNNELTLPNKLKLEKIDTNINQNPKETYNNELFAIYQCPEGKNISLSEGNIE